MEGDSAVAESPELRFVGIHAFLAPMIRFAPTLCRSLVGRDGEPG